MTKLLQGVKTLLYRGFRKANGNRYTDEYLLGRNKASTKILALYVYIRL